MGNLVFSLSYMYYYVGSILAIVYVLAAVLAIKKINKIKLRDVTAITIIFFLVFIKLVTVVDESQYAVLLSTARFYWGFIIFLLFFRYVDCQIDVSRYLWFFSILTIVEALLINTMVSPQILPNYPDFEIAKSHATAFLNFYQRPYGFGGNPAVSSSLLVILLGMSRQQGCSTVLTCVSTIAILLYASGSGYFLLLFSFMVKNRNYKFAKLFMGLLFFIVITLGDFTEDVGYKVSNAYINFLIDFKSGQVFDVISNWSVIEWILGVIPEAGQYGGDFGILYFFQSYGIMGIAVFFTIILMNLNRYNFFSILLLIIGSIHYPAIFFMPGQCLLGYLMSYKSSNGRT